MPKTDVVVATDRRFKGPAYRYIRESDRVPTTDEAYDLEDPKILVKLFNPGGAQTWYVCGFDPDTGLAFGAVDLGFDCCELGDFDLNEALAAVAANGFLPVERDLHWTPKPVSEVLA